MADNDIIEQDINRRWGAPAQAAPGAAPAGTPPLSYTVTPTLGPAADAGLKQYGGKGGEAAASDQLISKEYKNRVTPLNQAIPLAEEMGRTGTGPGSAFLNHLKSFVITMMPEAGASVGAIPDVDRQAKFDELNKYLTQYAQRSANAMSPSTNQGLETALTGNPSVGISNMATTDLLKMTLALERMNHAASRAFLDTPGLLPSDFPAFQARWATKADPRAYILDLLPPERSKAMLGEVAKSQNREDFAKQVKDAERLGLINLPSAATK